MRGLDVPERTEDFTADPVELFFDLAFVFAFSQLVFHLVHHPTWTGAAEAWLLFGMLLIAIRSDGSQMRQPESARLDRDDS